MRLHTQALIALLPWEMLECIMEEAVGTWKSIVFVK